MEFDAKLVNLEARFEFVIGLYSEFYGDVERCGEMWRRVA